MEAIAVTALALVFFNSVKELCEIASERRRRKQLRLLKTTEHN